MASLLAEAKPFQKISIPRKGKVYEILPRGEIPWPPSSRRLKPSQKSSKGPARIRSTRSHHVARSYGLPPHRGQILRSSQVPARTGSTRSLHVTRSLGLPPDGGQSLHKNFPKARGALLPRNGSMWRHREAPVTWASTQGEKGRPLSLRGGNS
eukprot:Gb_22342 [translate_table: standard]